MLSLQQTTYQAARSVARPIEQHFEQQLALAKGRGEQNLAPTPKAQEIEIMIDTAFWASLRREEGASPKISLAFLPPDLSNSPLIFEQRLSFIPAVLTKVAPAVERPGIHLGVWHEEGELYIWGCTRDTPNLCFVLDVSEPALLVVKHRRFEGFGKLANVAVLKGDQVKMVDEKATSLPDCPELLSTLLNFTSPSSEKDGINLLVQLAVSMRAHKRGGTLLVVPANSESWRKSIMHPILYAVSPAYSRMANLMRQEKSERSKSLWKGALRDAVEGVAGFTAVDGATLISDKYEVLAFGAKIGRPEGSTPIQKVVFTEPIVGSMPTTLSPTQSGGTRHLSAAQFVHDQPDSIALVASQDGAFTIFAWSPCEEMVYAHRVDTLLL